MTTLYENSVAKRFLSKVIKTDKCWNWSAGLSKNGYGAFRFNGKQDGAHRVSHILFIGEIPSGMVVMHTCDNKKCVNPEHLISATQTQNMRDCANKNRNFVPNHFKGNTNPKAKLTWQDAFEIRRLRNDGEKISNLSEKFKVSRCSIEKIIRGETWKI